jgi:hypothetical protein
MLPLCATSVFAGALDQCDTCPHQTTLEDETGRHLLCDHPGLGGE